MPATQEICSETIRENLHQYASIRKASVPQAAASFITIWPHRCLSQRLTLFTLSRCLQALAQFVQPIHEWEYQACSLTKPLWDPQIRNLIAASRHIFLSTQLWAVIRFVASVICDSIVRGVFWLVCTIPDCPLLSVDKNSLENKF